MVAFVTAQLLSYVCPNVFAVSGPDGSVLDPVGGRLFISISVPERVSLCGSGMVAFVNAQLLSYVCPNVLVLHYRVDDSLVIAVSVSE
jgi:hypothetical protein